MLRRPSVAVVVLACLLSAGGLRAAGEAHPSTPPAPEQFFGFRIGSDTKLARWDRIVDYMKAAAAASDRVRVRELGKTTNGNPFVAVEIASGDTLTDLDRFKQMERRLYLQGGTPTDAERDEIFHSGKAVVVVTCNIHATEIGSSQMAIELVHRLATGNSPSVRKILDNVILVLLPSLNPDGQTMVTDWYNKNLGTEFEGSSMPWLYHPYAGHDNNRDAYMLTQKESQYVAQLLWHDWFPSVWLDEHQQGMTGARIFVMPATDPINPNVHPLIYRWNAMLGQAQAAALEAVGKEGIIYNSTYTNYWEGAMAWAGWWHNEIGLLTEVASVRVASPTEQRKAELGRPPAAAPEAQGEGRRPSDNPGEILPPPRDVMPRTEYPRPWLGGRWTLRDIVDYELIATLGLLDAVADRRETLLRQIYEVNRATVESGKSGDVTSILITATGDEDAREAVHVVEKLRMGGVDVYRAEQAFQADGKSYPAGTFVVPMTQVFARYAKDMLEKQEYPEVRRTPTSAPEAPYDVTAWSLGMMLGADAVFVKRPLPDSVRLQRVDTIGFPKGDVTGTGQVFLFDYRGPDTAIAMNRLLREGARVTLGARQAGAVQISGIPRKRMESVAADFGLGVRAVDAPRTNGIAIHPPRVGLYQPWTANMDEGWTRWVLEQYEFAPRTLHNEEVRAGRLRDNFDVIVLPDQQSRDLVEGNTSRSTRKEYRGGIGSEGIAALKAFVADGGTLVSLGSACDFVIDNWPIPVRNLKRGLSRDQHFAPGTIVRIQADTANPLTLGLAPDTFGFYINSPFFDVGDGFPSQKTSVVVRYPNRNVVGSGWLKGEELMAGQAAVVTVDTNPGRLVLFGLRPQHRAQTHTTFPLLFNALYLSTAGGTRGGS